MADLSVMVDLLRFVTVSIKPEVATKLRDLSKLERHTLSDQLDIIIEYYALKKELN